MPAARGQLVDLGVHVADALVDARLVEVGEDDRHLEPPHEQQRQLGGHQAGADDADLGDLAGQRLVRRAGRPLGPLLHQVEGVEAGPQLVAHEQVGQRLVLGRGAGGERVAVDAGARQVEQLDGRARRRARRCACARRRSPSPGRSPRPRRRGRPPAAATVTSPPTHAGGPLQRPLQEVGRLEQGVGDAELRRLRRRRASCSASARSRRSPWPPGRCRSGSAAAACRPSRGPGRGRPRAGRPRAVVGDVR